MPLQDQHDTPPPRVTVVIPLFNRQALITETIASLRAQTEPSWEALVIDDGSTDRSYETVCELAESEHRIRLFRRTREPKGAPTCRNIGVSKSRGKFVMFLDSDDLLSPSCLEDRLSSAGDGSDGKVRVFLSEMFKTVPGDSETLWNYVEANTSAQFFRGNSPWCITGPFWPRPILHTVGEWNQTLKSMQDWEYHCRAILTGVDFDFLHHVDNYIRAVDTHASISNPTQPTGAHERLLHAVESVAAFATENNAWTPPLRCGLSGICMHVFTSELFSNDRSMVQRTIQILTDHSIQPWPLRKALSKGLASKSVLMKILLEELAVGFWPHFLHRYSYPYLRNAPKRIDQAVNVDLATPHYKNILTGDASNDPEYGSALRHLVRLEIPEFRDNFSKLVKKFFTRSS